MMENGRTDHEPISARATSLSTQHRESMRLAEMGHGATALYEAIAKASQAIPLVLENTKAGARSKYAPLESIIQIVVPILREHHLIIRQGQERSYGADDGGTKTRIFPIFTDIIHWPTGQMHRTTIEIPAPRMDPQGVGSAITYGKRYSLLAALGLATADDPVDDDGAAGRKREITDEVNESQTLLSLKAAIDKITDEEKLVQFKIGEAGQKLDEGEFHLLRVHWMDRRQALRDGAK